jgi:hypothetical protein
MFAEGVVSMGSDLLDGSIGVHLLGVVNVNGRMRIIGFVRSVG